MNDTRSDVLDFSQGIYRIPVSYRLFFGVDLSPESHQGLDKHAVDFLVPEGSRILAPRDGVVYQVAQDSDRGGPSKEFESDANYIILNHGNGETSIVVHLRKNSACVVVGESVKRGQPLALQGSTGWSTEPHVHMAVYQLNGSVSVKWSFWSYVRMALLL